MARRSRIREIKGAGRLLGIALAVSMASGLVGCQTFRELAALEKVDFLLRDVDNIDLAGVRLDGIRSFGDLGPAQVVRLLAAVGQGRLPLQVRVNVLAENPSSNPVTARMIGLDWTLLLEGKETVAGSIANAVSLPPGAPQVIPIDASLDLLQFFSESGPDLVELVLALTGQGGGESKEIAIRATPTIDTPLGPMTYPTPITILRQEVGR